MTRVVGYWSDDPARAGRDGGLHRLDAPGAVALCGATVTGRAGASSRNESYCSACGDELYHRELAGPQAGVGQPSCYGGTGGEGWRSKK